MLFLREYYEFDGSKKDKAWAEKIIRYFRQYVRPIVDPVCGMRNDAILMGRHEMKNVMDMFRNPDKAHINFAPIPILETIRQVLITENQSDGTYVTLSAEDPTAQDQRKEDKALLKNRKLIEAMMSNLNQKVGLPPYQLQNEKHRTGKDVYNGNIDQFDEMGLNENEPDDIDHFYKLFYRLDHEISAETAVNAVMRDNEVIEQIPVWLNDILANKTMCVHTYVDDVSGKITHTYLRPWELKAIKRRRLDYKDSPIMMWERNVTVREFISMMGNEFDADRDMPVLLKAVFMSTGILYTGITVNGVACWGIPPGDDTRRDNISVDYYQFLQFSVALGYAEWKSNNSTAYKVSDNNKHGNISMMPKSASWTPAEHSVYRKDSWYNEMTYKTYYLITSTFESVLYKYGLLNNQHVEGSEDEYSNFSIVVYQESGKSAVEIATPYLELLYKAWYKFEWMVIRAKPPGRSYNYEGLVEMAKAMFPENGNNVPVSVDRMLTYLHQAANEVYMFPKIDGQPIGGGSQVNFDMPNGLSKSAMDFLQVYQFCINEINERLGTAPKQPNDPQPRESLGLNKIMESYSNKSTYYIRRMMNSCFNHLGIRTIAWIQDIIQFRNKSSLAYKYLCRLLGTDIMDQMEKLNNIALHRYNITVDTFYDAMTVEQFDASTTQALVNKEISYEQFLLIKSIKNPKRAYQILSYEKKRTERVQQQQAQQLAQQQQQAQQQLAQSQMQIEQMKIQGELQKQQIQGDYLLKSTQSKGQEGIIKKQMDINNTPEKIEAQKEADIETQQAAQPI